MQLTFWFLLEKFTQITPMLMNIDFLPELPNDVNISQINVHDIVFSVSPIFMKAIATELTVPLF